jgi:hypothetical protein
MHVNQLNKKSAADGEQQHIIARAAGASHQPITVIRPRCRSRRESDITH